MIQKLQEQHDIVLHPCLQWGSADIDTILERDGVNPRSVTADWKHNVITQALEDNAEQICELINSCISDYMEMIKDEDYKEEMF